MVFSISMLVWSAFFTGYGLASGHWITFGIQLGCAIYWTVSIIYKNKKKKETTVTMSDEAKETLKNLGMKVVVNGKEIV